MHRSDVIAGFGLCLLGLFTIFVIAPEQISGDSDYGIAPDVYPLTVLWIFTLLSAALCIHRLIKWSVMTSEPILTRADWVFVVGAALYMVVAYLAIEHLGFRWAGMGLLLILFFIMGVLPKYYIKAAIVAGISPLLLYYLFWDVFRIPLP